MYIFVDFRVQRGLSRSSPPSTYESKTETRKKRGSKDGSDKRREAGVEAWKAAVVVEANGNGRTAGGSRQAANGHM